MITRRSLLGMLAASPLALALSTPVSAMESDGERTARLMAEIQARLAELNTLNPGRFIFIEASEIDRVMAAGYRKGYADGRRFGVLESAPVGTVIKVRDDAYTMDELKQAPGLWVRVA